MPRYKVMYDSTKSGYILFDAESETHATELYEALMDGEIGLDDLYEAEEFMETQDSNYYELTTDNGNNVAN